MDITKEFLNPEIQSVSLTINLVASAYLQALLPKTPKRQLGITPAAAPSGTNLGSLRR